MAKKNTTIELVSVANLDDKNIYQGVKHIPKSELTASDVLVPSDCDLAIGGYQWDADKKTFMPTLVYIQQQLNKG